MSNKTKIDIATIQETETENGGQETRDPSNIYHSGGNRINKEGRFETGVAIIIAKYLESVIETIIPISDRIILIKISYVTPIIITGVYALQAKDRNKCCSKLKAHMANIRVKYPL